jgi:DMSO reductase family type II enzyme chaperone
LPTTRGATVPEDFDGFQSEYIRLFEVGGRGGAPCPLNSGHYATDRLRSLESLVRFYNFFGVQAEQGMMPDHVTIELEFMSFLAETEAAAKNESDRRSCRRAQADFLGSHLASWWPKITEKIKGQEPLPFYRSLADLTSRFLEADLKYVA